MFSADSTTSNAEPVSISIKTESAWVPSMMQNGEPQSDQLAFAMNIIDQTQAELSVSTNTEVTDTSSQGRGIANPSTTTTSDDTSYQTAAPLLNSNVKSEHVNRRSFENFHLDPNDFQNLLMTNPPILEYPYPYPPNQQVPADDWSPSLSLPQAGVVPHEVAPSYASNYLPANVMTDPESQSSTPVSASHHFPLRRRVSISNGQIGQISMMCHKKDSKKTKADEENDLHVNEQGVPQQQLFYNNEVIFNPNAGPIHGTSAWKKQRILERNRIAAFKCRQKKKVQQEKLQQDNDILAQKNAALIEKNRQLENLLLRLKEELSKCEVTDTVADLLAQINIQESES
ncbi:hypothetical protein KL930_002076 [Ogataea haglerorum]|uniref:BZIP domain-containing protein n=1 Tax=Ogataea haglerorum TaxID=1937702 RepID=A0AAN6D6S1_9ASCO|nr:uncharacterized protein KL911_000319 [Ogataea haglerorum]KAG7699137.1 hypothetical protein KL915_001429 [Ogataea haglerorum]KAG7700739.1 hypothetical protein KL951_000854 [Ogataea haglerorum]KAG7710179.1 hypothetical protein KL914_001089 [Ogataea haglerorum]KAG7711040.1 hypothetical protein KL950_001006 [Ogataea haglerorum]KAG7720338.1 hypothetical protein KL913_001238 [Ogataea haglerorum]